ncbi:hypothetical protein V1506DRAFT_525385 [Lipomyces tetrasporus]
MENALLKAIKIYKRWNIIENRVKQAVQQTEQGVPLDSNLSHGLLLLKGISQGNLKDKARNIKHGLILQGKEIPLALKDVTVSTKVMGRLSVTPCGSRGAAASF